MEEKAPSVGTLKKMLFYSFFVVLPLSYSTLQVDPSLNPSLFTIIAYSIVFTIVFVQRLRFSWRLFYLPAILLMSAVWAINSGEAIFRAAMVFSCFYFLTVIHSMMEEATLSKASLVKGVLLAVSIYAIIAVIQIFFGTDFFKVKDICSTLANENLLSFVLYLGCAIAIYAIEARCGPSKPYTVALLLFFVALLIYLQTKSIAPAIVVALCAFSWFRLHKGLAFTLNAVVVGGVFFAMYSIDLDNESFGARIKLWQNSILMFQDHFLTGVGAGNWKIWFPFYGIDSLSLKTGAISIETLQFNRIFLRAHNDFLTLLCETGVVGLPVFYFIGREVFYRFRSGSKVTLSLCLLFAFFVIALIDFPFHRATHILLFGLAFLITGNGDGHTHSVSRWTPLPVLLFCTILFSMRSRSEYYTRKTYAAFAKSDWSDVFTFSMKSYHFFYTIDPLSNPVEWFTGMSKVGAGKYNEGISYLEKAVDKHPHHPRVRSDLASAYLMIDRYKESIEQYKRALAISPHFERVRLNLAVAYFNSGDITSAKVEMKKLTRFKIMNEYKQLEAAIEQAEQQ